MDIKIYNEKADMKNLNQYNEIFKAILCIFL